MSLRNKEPLPDLNGKIVISARADVDDKGYGFVELRFADGAVLRVEEYGQCGQIEWKLDAPARLAQR